MNPDQVPYCDLSVGFHQQDNGFCCGAACAQMLLVSDVNPNSPLGGDLDPNKSDFQQTWPRNPDAGLWGEICDCMDALIDEPAGVGAFAYDSDHYGTHPDVLARALNDRKSSEYTNVTFQVFASADPREIDCRIIHTIERYQIAPVVLIWGGQHWVVVAGCNYVSDSSVPENIEVKDFLVKNPYPEMNFPSHHDPPHASNDKCGEGAVPDGRNVDYRGFSGTHIPYKYWCGEYMRDPIDQNTDTPAYSPLLKCPPPSNLQPTGSLKGKYVAVCAVDADDKGPAYKITNPQYTCPIIDASKLEDPKHPDYHKAAVINAVDTALAYLQDTSYYLSQRSHWCDFVSGLPGNLNRYGEGGVEDSTVFVSGQFKGPDCYLVPIILNSGDMPAVVRAVITSMPDPSAGGNPGKLSSFECMDSVAVPPEATASTPASLAAGQVDIRVGLPLPGAPIDLGIKDLGTLNSRLVWQPCMQSFSPVLPFYEIDLGTPDPQVGRIIYLRADFQEIDPGSPSHQINLLAFTHFETSLAGI